MSKFERENKYLVFKRSDLTDLPEHMIKNMIDLVVFISQQRARLNKSQLECVVVEKDWPEYECVWSMIEERVLKEQEFVDSESIKR